MNKFFLLALVLSVSLGGLSIGSASAASLDEEADNLTATSPEQQAEVLKNYHQRLQYRLNHYSPDKLKAVINNTQKIDKRYEKRRNSKNAAANAPEQINIDNRAEVKGFFQGQVETDPGPQSYFD